MAENESLCKHGLLPDGCHARIPHRSNDRGTFYYFDWCCDGPSSVVHRPEAREAHEYRTCAERNND